MTTAKYFVAAFLLLSAVCVGAAQSEKSGSSSALGTSPPEQSMDMREVIALLQQQQKELARQQQDLVRQSQLLDAQSQQITGLKSELDALRSPSTPVSEQTIARTEVAIRAATPQMPQIPGKKDDNTSQSTTKTALASEASSSVASAQIDDPTRASLTDFRGAWRLPGTAAALRIGGYVKSSTIYNFDPLQNEDRFIVGSIPVGNDNSSQDVEARTVLTAAQSRLNFDLREPTEVGLMRAFIEGDFAGDGDTFRLRHAFGQWNRVLAGKTWSAFMDTEASPEEVDFEGLNGRIHVRQAQVRFSPSVGKAYALELSMENPDPEVQNGQGASRMPDFVVAARFAPNNRLHLKLGLLGRQIRAQQDAGVGTGVEKKFAGGLNVSGRLSTPLFDARDNLVFQFNAGNGIGRYVNDLSSIGDFDGIFNTGNGKLELFDIVAGYVSWQHWWGAGSKFRSNFTIGAVGIDNPDIADGEAYKSTLRFSSNIFWAPIRRVDLGAEYLWGERKNEDGQTGDATQIQLAARYRF